MYGNTVIIREANGEGASRWFASFFETAILNICVGRTGVQSIFA